MTNNDHLETMQRLLERAMTERIHAILERFLAVDRERQRRRVLWLLQNETAQRRGD